MPVRMPAFLMLHPTPKAIPREKKTKQNNLLRWFI